VDLEGKENEGGGPNAKKRGEQSLDKPNALLRTVLRLQLDYILVDLGKKFHLLLCQGSGKSLCLENRQNLGGIWLSLVEARNRTHVYKGPGRYRGKV